MKLKISFLFLITCLSSFSQEETFTESNVNINIHVDGTLLVPVEVRKPNLVIIIPGSGPTNRDGNQNFIKNNSLKKLAEGLTNNGIATFRYDKRVVKQIRDGNVDENTMFDDFVTDAKTVLEYFKSKKEFKRIYMLGHSQGSLVGMLAAKEQADGFISIAGLGKTVDLVITEQISNTAPMFIEDTKKVFKSLKEGITTEDYPPALASLFKMELQPFIMNWMQYDPKAIIKDLKIPVLIINGTKDIQVPVNYASLLKEGNPSSELVIIEKMNHVLVPIEGDNLENTKAYNEPHRELSKELVPAIISFIK
ncbi:MAG: alpha/beta hydrolase [Flavobacteriaceae bacterium]|nr:alpha/beta hydrolase [Flavobacteriaceae bacterium]